MGNCCSGIYNDNDILNDFDISKNKENKKENKLSIDNNNIINQTRQNTAIDNNVISNKKLKLTIKQSKSLQEGKEYIINSLGLLINNKNKTQDGLTIFGDINVIKYIYIIYNIFYFIIIVKYKN